MSKFDYDCSGWATKAISLANTLSVIADPYVQEHFCNLRYVTLYGGKWKVTDASVEYPRIVLTLGGLWHGNETE